MNISILDSFAIQNGWKPVRKLKYSCQYKNLQDGRLLTVSVPDGANIPDTVNKLFTAKELLF